MPIALLSQARKIVESALELAIKERYIFAKLETGFQKHLSTATAINKTLEGRRHGKRYIALLDLKGTYDRLPRDALYRLLSKCLPQWLSNMVKYFLQPQLIRTVGVVQCKVGSTTAFGTVLFWSQVVAWQSG